MKFNFTEQEIGYIFEILKKRPFEECSQLISKIQGQYTEQKDAIRQEEEKKENE